MDFQSTTSTFQQQVWIVFVANWIDKYFINVLRKTFNDFCGIHYEFQVLKIKRAPRATRLLSENNRHSTLIATSHALSELTN